MKDYASFLASKRQLAGDFGFEPTFMPDSLFLFQKDLVEWATLKGRAALFADCGLGKTLMQLVWSQNVANESGGRVLILTPLAVSHQTVAEAHKFGMEAARSNEGELPAQIVVTNYERLHHFNPDDFAGVVCDESSILKNFDGSTRKAITDFMQTRKYRLLCTATAAPNDYTELGTSSEALGILSWSHMMSYFFNHDGGDTGQYRLRHYASEGPFWQWLCSWSRALRRPSDIGHDNHGFILPPLRTRQHVVKSSSPNPEFLFDMPAVGLAEQREERKRTMTERCEMAAALAMSHDQPVVCWCHLNQEGNLLEKLIDGAVQVSGSDSDERKEESFRAFESGQARVIVTKPTIAGFGLNWQHCAHQTFFPSHSFEQWYQAVRRCWRFGQKNPVTVDVVTSEGEQRVLTNLERKADAASLMFSKLVEHMGNEFNIERKQRLATKKESIPSWL